MSKNTVLLIIIVVCLSALVYLGIARGPENSPPPLPEAPPGAGRLPPGHPPVGGDESTKAPDFTLESLASGRVTLSNYRGKVVMLNFWSAGCPPCLMEMPSLENLKKAMAGKPFEILAITSDPRYMAENMVEKINLTLPVLLDPDGKTAMSYGAYATPTTIIIAPDGSVDNAITGAANWADGSVVDYMNKLIFSGNAVEDKH